MGGNRHAPGKIITILACFNIALRDGSRGHCKILIWNKEDFPKIGLWKWSVTEKGSVDTLLITGYSYMGTKRLHSVLAASDTQNKYKTRGEFSRRASNRLPITYPLAHTDASEGCIQLRSYNCNRKTRFNYNKILLSEFIYELNEIQIGYFNFFPSKGCLQFDPKL